ncbi:hypothetical protein SCA6_002183 [Theobroma cacao]
MAMPWVMTLWMAEMDKPKGRIKEFSRERTTGGVNTIPYIVQKDKFSSKILPRSKQKSVINS